MEADFLLLVPAALKVVDRFTLFEKWRTIYWDGSGGSNIRELFDRSLIIREEVAGGRLYLLISPTGPLSHTKPILLKTYEPPSPLLQNRGESKGKRQGSTMLKSRGIYY